VNPRQEVLNPLEDLIFHSGLLSRQLMTTLPKQVVELNHSLVKHHLIKLRHKETHPAEFRQQVEILSTLLAVEATRDLRLRPTFVETPIETTDCLELDCRVAAVPILRAGLGMVKPLSDLIPELAVWHLGLYRDEETAMPVHYYDKLPASNPPDVGIVLDPMLATGGSAAMAIEALQRWKVPRILMLSLIAAPEGISRLTDQFPNVQIYTCAIDRCLNEKKYIVPGLGDAGDRIFNT
jgi:uracil phosphoribosyltransferase